MACEYCNNTHGHDPRCPYAPEELPILSCVCSAPIFEGDYYYNVDGQIFCEECFKEYSYVRFGHYAER